MFIPSDLVLVYILLLYELIGIALILMLGPKLLNIAFDTNEPSGMSIFEIASFITFSSINWLIVWFTSIIMALATSAFIYTPLMTWLLSYLQSSILFLDNCSLIGFF